MALVKALCRKLCSVEDLQGALGLETFNESAWQRRLLDKAFTVLLDLTPVRQACHSHGFACGRHARMPMCFSTSFESRVSLVHLVVPLLCT